MTKKIGYILILLITCTLVAGTAAADSQTKPGSGEHDYLIGSGDILEIVTWKEEDFSREEVLVRLDGKITFPLLNDVQAAGLSTMDLKGKIEQGLKNYVTNPVVTVSVKEPLSKKFYILGEVMRTGEYPLVKHLTVLQAFALAGGFTEWAAKKEIILLRHEAARTRYSASITKTSPKAKTSARTLNSKPTIRL